MPECSKRRLASAALPLIAALAACTSSTSKHDSGSRGLDAESALDVPVSKDAEPLDLGSAPSDTGVERDASGGLDAVADAAPDATPDTGPGPLDVGFWDSGPDAGFTTITIVDEGGNQVMITESPAGPPGVMGCSDGTREGLLDLGTFPKIAACLGTWTGTASMRARTTSVACGNSLGNCALPADMCSIGWRVCSSTGAVSDLTHQLTPQQCDNAGGGRYVAGISHCIAQSGCQYDYSPGAVYPCFDSGWCSESVCCGEQCRSFGACPSGVWVNDTHIAIGTDQGCGMISSRRAGGVLCCRK